MLIKIAIVLVLIVIVGSLFSALFFLAKDKGAGERTAKALTIRITLSIVLFVCLMLGYMAGIVGH
jgi:hypothetical protein